MNEKETQNQNEMSSSSIDILQVQNSESTVEVENPLFVQENRPDAFENNFSEEV